jgi:hypothetical protein
MSITQSAELALLHLVSFALALASLFLAILTAAGDVASRILHVLHRGLHRLLLPLRIVITAGRICARSLKVFISASVSVSLSHPAPPALRRVANTQSSADKFRDLERYLRAELRAAEEDTHQDLARIIGRMLEVVEVEKRAPPELWLGWDKEPQSKAPNLVATEIREAQ